AGRGAYANTHRRDKPSGERKEVLKAMDDARAKKEAYDKAREYFLRRDRDAVQSGKLGVDLSLQTAGLRGQTRLEQTALRQVRGRPLMEIGGVWIDEAFTAQTPALVVKAQSDAYFKLLEKRPELKDVFRLGNHLVWLPPSGTALFTDLTEGKKKLEDKEIAKLFTAKKCPTAPRPGALGRGEPGPAPARPARGFFLPPSVRPGRPPPAA